MSGITCFKEWMNGAFKSATCRHSKCGHAQALLLRTATATKTSAHSFCAAPANFRRPCSKRECSRLATRSSSGPRAGLAASFVAHAVFRPCVLALKKKVANDASARQSDSYHPEQCTHYSAFGGRHVHQLPSPRHVRYQSESPLKAGCQPAVGLLSTRPHRGCATNRPWSIME